MTLILVDQLLSGARAAAGRVVVELGERAACSNRGGPIGEFFTALGPGWRLTVAQRARLATAVTAAGPDFDHAASITAWSNALRLQYAALPSAQLPWRSGGPAWRLIVWGVT